MLKVSYTTILKSPECRSSATNLTLQQEILFLIFRTLHFNRQHRWRDYLKFEMKGFRNDNRKKAKLKFVKGMF